MGKSELALCLRTDLVDLVARERRIGRHQKVASRCRNEGRDDAHEVIVHVTRITQRLCTRSHHRRNLSQEYNISVQSTFAHASAHELVRLIKRGRLYVQPIGCYPRQRTIIEHDDRIGVVR